jgi:hypothetical protein
MESIPKGAAEYLRHNKVKLITFLLSNTSVGAVAPNHYQTYLKPPIGFINVINSPAIKEKREKDQGEKTRVQHNTPSAIKDNRFMLLDRNTGTYGKVITSSEFNLYNTVQARGKINYTDGITIPWIKLSQLFFNEL